MCDEMKLRGRKWSCGEEKSFNPRPAFFTKGDALFTPGWGDFLIGFQVETCVCERGFPFWESPEFHAVSIRVF
jgi:hypothetical protein